jgi:uncharacterized membrane protein (UPF0136 family)
MPWLSIAVIIYGIAVGAGGAMGFAMKHSWPSLISGGIAGILLVILGFISNSNPKFGYGLSAGIAVALIALFVVRFIQTKSPMPAMGVIGLSVLMLILLAVGHFMKSGATPTP